MEPWPTPRRPASGSATRFPTFALPDTDGVEHAVPQDPAPAATVLVVTCNHCPYVIAWNQRLRAAAEDYADRGVRFLGINANDAARYPADSLEAMQRFVRDQSWPYPVPARRGPVGRARARRRGDAARVRARRRAPARLPRRAGRRPPGREPRRRVAARGARRGARRRRRRPRRRPARAGARSNGAAEDLPPRSRLADVPHVDVHAPRSCGPRAASRRRTRSARRRRGSRARRRRPRSPRYSMPTSYWSEKKYGRRS